MHASDPSVARSRRRRLPTSIASVVLALASLGLAAAGASAATIAVTQACVVNANASSGAPMTVGGTGFTPGDMIDLTSAPTGAFDNTVADSTGSFAVTFPAPILGTIDPASRSFTLQATDLTDNVTTASTAFHVANLAVITNPLQAKPSRKVTWSFSGFTSGAQIFVHYLRAKKVITTARFGRTTGPCGTLRKRAVFFPGHAKYKTYKLQIDDARRYSAHALPRLTASLKTGIPS